MVENSRERKILMKWDLDNFGGDPKVSSAVWVRKVNAQATPGPSNAWTRMSSSEKMDGLYIQFIN